MHVTRVLRKQSSQRPSIPLLGINLQNYGCLSRRTRGSSLPVGALPSLSVSCREPTAGPSSTATCSVSRSRTAGGGCSAVPAGPRSSVRPAGRQPSTRASAGLRTAPALPAPPLLEPLSRTTRPPPAPRSAPRASAGRAAGHARSAEFARSSGGVWTGEARRGSVSASRGHRQRARLGQPPCAAGGTSVRGSSPCPAPAICAHRARCPDRAAPAVGAAPGCGAPRLPLAGATPRPAAAEPSAQSPRSGPASQRRPGLPAPPPGCSTAAGGRGRVLPLEWEGGSKITAVMFRVFFFSWAFFFFFFPQADLLDSFICAPVFHGDCCSGGINL